MATIERDLYEKDLLAGGFEKYRARLRDRMLGTAGEADDAFQETWLRLGRSDTTVNLP